MPGGDRTGPGGFGPMTGRGMGYCSGYPYPGFMNPEPGFGFSRGLGMGRGFGRGLGRGWYPLWPYAHPVGHWFFTKEEEKTFLQSQASILKEQLSQIKKRLDTLERQSKEKNKK